MNLQFLDLLALIGYLAIITGVGVYFSRKNTNTEEYFVGGRSFGGWVIGLSLVGTSISSITFLAYPGDAFKTSWLRYVPNLMLPIAVVFAAYYFLPFFRRRNTTTAYEYLEDRFGPSIRVYGAVAFIIAQLVRISMILFLLSMLIQELTGLSTVWAIIVGGIIVATYTIIGGIDAVIWTDVMQTIVLLLGGLLCLWVIVDALPGGFGQIFSVADEFNKFSFSVLQDGQLSSVGWGLQFDEKTVSMMLFIGLIAWLTEYSSNQNTVQRYCASRSTAEARKAMLIAVASSLPIWAFYMFLGTALFVFFQQFPAVPATEMLTGGQSPEGILPYFISNHLPAGIAGLVIASALAAAMSSLDSSINAISTVSIVDIYRRHLKPKQNDKHYLQVAWLIATATSIFMILGAIFLAKADSNTLQDTATILTSILGGGLLGLYLIGFFTKKGDARAIWVGLASTIVFTSWTILSKNDLLPASIQVPFDLYYTGFVGNVIMFVVSYLAATFIFPSKKDLSGLTVYDLPKT
ncbi:sodium/solute symporter [Bermanella sp. R86510]|uniref:sodium:solute symporter family transporter n=1 Tax=unclassified Bermanella TaxID=2627862 RepID=UPI0037C7795D